MTEPVTQPPAEPSPAQPTVPATDAAPLSTADRWRRFDRWSSVFFLSLAAVAFVAALTVLSAAEAAGTDVLAWLITVTIATVALLLAAAFALDRETPWARTTAVGLLVVVVATDAVRVVVDLTRSSITIPLAAIVALCLLSIRPGPLARLWGRDRSVALAIVGLFLVVSLLEVASVLAAPVAATSVP